MAQDADTPRVNNTRSFRVDDLEKWERFKVAAKAGGQSRSRLLNEFYEAFTSSYERERSAA